MQLHVHLSCIGTSLVHVACRVKARTAGFTFVVKSKRCQSFKDRNFAPKIFSSKAAVLQLGLSYRLISPQKFAAAKLQFFNWASITAISPQKFAAIDLFYRNLPPKI